MSKRKKMKVNGEMLPMMAGGYIRPTFYPPAPRKVNFPDAPKGLSKAALEKWMRETSGKVDAAIAAENARWQRERVPDTQIRIEFMAWAWEGHESGGEHVKNLDGAWLDMHGLHLPDGRVVHGRAVELPNDRILANKAVLDMELATAQDQIRPPPNPKGREPEYDPKDDARIFDLYKAQPERISIETFREENPKIKQDYTLRELRRLIDRERKRRNAGLAKKALKRNKRQ